jgi:hypothetical protein
MAQDRDQPGELWKQYPLAPTAEPSATPVVTSTPAAGAQVEDRPRRAAQPGSDNDVQEALLGLLALLTAAGAMALWLRRRGSEAHAPAESRPDAPAGLSAPVVSLWHRPSGRFARTAPSSDGPRVPQPIRAFSSGQGGTRERLRGDDDAPAANPRGGGPPVTEVAQAPAGSPPDRTQAWTAEIEWRNTEDESRFCVVARGSGEAAVAESAPLEWPPAGAAALRAMTDATEELAATLLAAGWKPLPRGGAWYAKRFAWEPVAERADAAQPSPLAVAAPDQHANRPDKPHVPLIALLCALIALGSIAALQLRGGDDKAPPARATPTPVNSPAATGSAPAAKPKAAGGVDLTLPLLILLGGVVLAVVIRQVVAREAER